jgi:cytochrome c-type biogenesis protein CcmE
VVAAFTASANPYVETVAEAKTSGNDRMHLAGDIVKGSVSQDVKTGRIHFKLRDAKGEVIEVLHRGDPPANMGEATKVVAVGGIKDGFFESQKLLVKCPSKYEGVEKKQ